TRPAPAAPRPPPSGTRRAATGARAWWPFRRVDPAGPTRHRLSLGHPCQLDQHSATFSQGYEGYFLGLILFLVFLGVTAAVAMGGFAQPVTRHTLGNFSRLYQVDVTPYNGAAILRYLHVTQRPMWTGMAIGFAVMFAQLADKSSTVGPFWPVTGWFCGFAVAEMFLARRGGPLGRPLAFRLVPQFAGGLWVFAAVVSAALALASVFRSFEAEVDLAERGWAVFTLAVVLTVSLLLMGLRRRALRAGPADLVSAEFAMRCRSARLLVAGGTIVAIWAAPGGDWPPDEQGYRTVVNLLVPLLAWSLAQGPVQPTPAH